MDPHPRLAHLPVSFFASVMGLAGLGLAWRKAAAVLGAPAEVGNVVLMVAGLVFLILLVSYVAKLARHPGAVVAELRHPVKLNFFATISIALILLGTGLTESAPVAARVLWGAGAGVHLVLTTYVMSAWIHHTHFEVAHVNPAWFIPVVGNIIVPIAGTRFGLEELSWFFFSVGLVFWIALFTIVLYRLFFHAALPDRLRPTLFILIAPPAVGFVSYVALAGQVDAFARVLLYTALMLTLLLASNALRFLRLKFFLSAWAYSFPLAAVTLATLVMAERIQSVFFAGLGAALLLVLTLVVSALAVRTLVAVGRGEICQPEG